VRGVLCFSIVMFAFLDFYLLLLMFCVRIGSRQFSLCGAVRFDICVCRLQEWSVGGVRAKVWCVVYLFLLKGPGGGSVSEFGCCGVVDVCRGGGQVGVLVRGRLGSRMSMEFDGLDSAVLCLPGSLLVHRRPSEWPPRAAEPERQRH